MGYRGIGFSVDHKIIDMQPQIESKQADYNARLEQAAARITNKGRGQDQVR